VQSQATTSVSGLSQLAAEAALRAPGVFTETMQVELQRRRDVLFDALAVLPGVELHKPQGAFYLFAGVQELIRRAGLQGDVELSGALLERAGVAVVPGSAFHAEGFLRLSYATSLAQLERAASGISRVFGQF